MHEDGHYFSQIVKLYDANNTEYFRTLPGFCFSPDQHSKEPWRCLNGGTPTGTVGSCQCNATWTGAHCQACKSILPKKGRTFRLPSARTVEDPMSFPAMAGQSVSANSASAVISASFSPAPLQHLISSSPITALSHSSSKIHSSTRRMERASARDCSLFTTCI